MVQELDAPPQRDAPPPPRRDGIPRRQRLSTWVDQRLSGYLMVSPFFLIFVIFGLAPILFTAWIALHDWHPIGGGEWVGMANFRNLMDDPRFWNATRNTLSIWVLSTVPQLVLAIAIAHVLHTRQLRGGGLFKMSLLVPNVTSVIAVGIVFTSMFGRDYGLINAVLQLLGFDRIEWQSGTLSSHVAIAVMVMWRWTGYNALIYLAGMQTIPRDLFESADIDGASSLRKLIHVTIPMIRPTIIFTVIISTIGGMQLFAEPLTFDTAPGSVSGGNARQFQTLTMLLYEQGFRGFRFGYASAIAWMLFLFIAVFSLINYLLTKRIASSK
jgi:cellobiose transport system permease protein